MAQEQQHLKFAKLVLDFLILKPKCKVWRLDVTDVVREGAEP